MIDLTRFSGARVLVAGASGFLGRPLVRRLMDLGAEVTAASRRVPPQTDVPQWIAADASDPQQAAKLFEHSHPEIVYVLTSESRGGPDLDLVQPTLRNDLLASINLLVEATRHRCSHVVVTGSGDEPAGSSAPSTPYAAAKLALLSYARMFVQLYGTPIVILRPMVTYGPGQKGYKVIPSTIEALLQDRPARIGSGERGVDWVYLDDMVDALLAAGVCPPAVGAIDIGSGTLVSLRDCVSLLGSLLGRSHLLEFDAALDRPFEEDRAADTRAALRHLGWRASTPLRQGLERTIAAYQSQPNSESRG